jgi:myo-inositol 2-dehydrogenase/D-chiro-inositol 1-dehydrogenase
MVVGKYWCGTGRGDVLDILYDDKRMHWTSGKVVHARDGKTEEETRRGKQIDAVFIEALRAGDPSAIRSDYSDAIKSMAISIAANESGRTGKVAKVQV